MPRTAWATTLLLVAAGFTPPAAAQPLAPDGPPPPSPSGSSPAPLEELPPAATPVPRPSVPARPPSILEAPIAVGRQRERSPTESDTPRDSAPIPASFTDAPERKRADDPPPEPKRRERAAGLGVPSMTGYAGIGADGAAAPVPVPVSAAATEGAIRRASATAPAAPYADPVSEFLGRRAGKPGDRAKAADPDRDDEPKKRPSRKFGDRLHGILGEQGEWFKSDHAFDGFISPVTNPFLFEDPRSLTEIRPIFIYQRIPNNQKDFLGGNVSFFGTQARLAITERLSFTINKLGGVWLNPNSASPIDGDGGFAEVWFGPKYTFVRDFDTGSLLAGGLQFQVPVGSKDVFQNSGGLSIVPYATYGRKLFKDFSWGSFNTLVNGGYSFATSRARSDYLYVNGHLDWDVMNWGRFYPLLETTYTVTTSNGNSYPIGAEGRDLFNFGGQAKGHGLWTGAAGARFKITENAQLGGAFEVPLAGNRDLFRYRVTFDFILRF